MSVRVVVGAIAAAIAAVNSSGATAQTKSQQVVKPPVAQLWMDVATMTMPGMPDMASIPGAGALGGLFGAGGGARQQRVRQHARHDARPLCRYRVVHAAQTCRH